MDKDKKKGIGFIIMAVVSAVCAVLCFTLGYIPDWVSSVCTLIGGVCVTLGIYWVNPVQNLANGEQVVKSSPNSAKKLVKTGSKLFGRDNITIIENDKKA